MRWVLALGLLAACSAEPGRPPEFADAQPKHDAAFADARPIFPDALPRDTGVFDGSIALYDSGVLPPEYPFTGIFGILNDSTLMYAREVEGRLSIVIGQFPYVYEGTIDRAGRLTLGSWTLAGAGCTGAALTGTFDRGGRVYTLHHTTCTNNGTGPQAQSDLYGGFNADFDLWSGVYELQATVVQDVFGCWRGQPGPFVVRWGVNFIGASNAAAVFAGVDVVDTKAVLLGTVNQAQKEFNVLQRSLAGGGGTLSASGTVQQPTLADTPRISGMRDVYNPNGPNGPCTFPLVFDGVRVAAP